MERKSPSGKKFRSKPQLARYLGSSMDLGTFDFRTGKMLMNKMNKNRQRMRYDCSNQAKGVPSKNSQYKPIQQGQHNHSQSQECTISPTVPQSLWMDFRQRGN